MNVVIRAFATVRDLIGTPEKEISLPGEIPVGKLLDILEADFPGLADLRGTLLFAINEEYCTGDELVRDGDVLAIFPPVSGG